MNDGLMLAFYKKENVAPVSQHINDLAAHMHRRETLYKQLGLSPAAFTGTNVLEIGPGTGQNALYIASRAPASLTLVEPNPRGVESIEETFAAFDAWRQL